MTAVNTLKILHEKRTWAEARDNCVSLGGKLFADLDGTETQINSLQQLLTERGRVWEYWLGIYANSSKIWKTTDDDLVNEELLIWDQGEPNNPHQTLYSISLTAEFLNDDDPRSELASICDME